MATSAGSSLGACKKGTPLAFIVSQRCVSLGMFVSRGTDVSHEISRPTKQPFQPAPGIE